RPRRRRGIPGWVWLAGAGGLLLVVVAVVVAILFGTGTLGPNRVTPENFAKLHTGMAESEVLALLGRPTRVDDSQRKLAEEMARAVGGPFGQKVDINETNYLRTLIWEKEGNRIEVDVINSR